MHKKNLIDKIKSVIRIPYYYVPPCPICGSVRTGRYVRIHSVVNDEYSNKMSLKNGELTKFTNSVDPDKQFFCSSCGAEWSELSSIKWLSLAQIDEEKKKRETGGLLDELLNEEKEEKKNRKGGPMGKLITGFIGHV